MATAISAIAPFAAVGAVKDAYRGLETVSDQLNEQTKLMRMCQISDKMFSKHEIAAAALVFALKSLRVAIQYKDCEEHEVTTSFLTGQ